MDIHLNRKDVSCCTRCIQTAQWPGLTFDAEGVCSNCRVFERYWAEELEPSREAALRTVFAKAAKKNPACQAVVGISGGKDSCYVLHLMRRHFKAKVLAVTWDNGFLSDIARKNIDRIVQKLGVEHRYISLEPHLRRRIYQAIIRNRCSDLCQVCMTGGLAAMNGVALKERIPLVVLGISRRTEPTALPVQLVCTADYRYLQETTGPFVSRKELSDFRFVSLPWAIYTMFIRRIRHVMLPDFVPWNESRIVEILAREYGWEEGENQMPHFDCLLYPAIEYFNSRRCGTILMVEKLSMMVRSGLLTRQQAQEKLKAFMPVAPPAHSLEELSRRMKIPEADLEPYLSGNTLDSRHFRNTTALLHHFRWIFWLTWRLGFTSDILYRKY